ncbi:protein EMBRYONIC FLOWER 1 isoform X2 [Malania oleifera]|uniref:protein EMBRYONIC FLOWER 1 isoform X2 n=1 Tax=Malania oleifera TaxID=397392 RepID=UPI0025AE7C40|nr:protein EMBRYONIC FLOWER 1 isoform X2 [Malania oleifera]
MVESDPVDTFNMEAIMSAEEIHHGERDSALASNSKSSTVKIDSIFIDLSNTEEKADAKSCEHFSIRGYVAQIREKDRKICWPFSFDDNTEEQTCTLPPLHDPKFRWWRCQNCLQEIDANESAKENGMGASCCKTGFKSKSTSTRLQSHSGVGMPLLDFQQALKPDIIEGRKDAANTFSDVHSNKYNLSLQSIRNEAHENGFQDVMNQEISRPTCAASGLNPSLMQQIVKDSPGIKLQCNGVVFCKADCGSHEVTDTQPAIRNLKQMVNCSAKTCQTEKHISVSGQHGDVMADFGTSKVVGVANEACNAAKGHESRHPSLEINKCSYALSASESDDDILQENNQHHANDNSSGLHCKKTRKVRLLTELLGAKKNTRSNHIGTEDSSSNATPDASTRPENSVAQGHEARGVRHQSSKSKMSHNEDWRSEQMGGPINVKKRVRFSKGDAESADINNATVGSELAVSAPPEIGLLTGMKSHSTKNRIDRKSIPCKKKLKKAQVADGCSLLLPLSDIVTKDKNLGNIGYADKDNDDHHAFFKSARDDSYDMVNHSFGCNLPAQFTEKKSSSRKKKKKIPQVEVGHTSLMPCNSGILSEGLTTRKDVKVIQMGPGTFPHQLAEDASHTEGLHLSLQKCLATQRNNRNYISPIEDGLEFLLPQQQSIPSEHQIMMKNVNNEYFGNSSVSFASAPDAFLGRQGCDDLSAKNNSKRMSFFSGSRNCTPQTEGEAFPLMRKKDLSATYRNEKLAGAKEHSDITKSGVRVNKVLHQGALDDIPMEIVELLAKNQYERRLHDAKNDHYLLGTTSNRRNAKTLDFFEVNGNGALRLLPEQNPHLQKNQSTTMRNGITTTDETARPNKQKSVNFFSDNRNHFSMSKLEETHASSVFSPFSQFRDKQSSGVQFSALGPNRSCSAQKCRFIGDTVGQRFSHTVLQGSEAYNTCQTPLHKKDEAGCVWSHMLPKDLHFGLDIPQTHPTHSSNMDMLSKRTGAMQKGKINGGHDLDILNWKSANPEKLDRNLTSETFNRTHAGYPSSCKPKGIEHHPKLMGSLDLYSNETIPAMHLLSLMDAGVRSNTTFNMDGNQKLLKKPSFSHDHYSKEFTSLGWSGAYKTGETSQYPPSEFCSKNNLPEKICECSPAGPAVCSFDSFQTNINFKGDADYADQVFLKSSREGKLSSRSPTQKRGHRPRKSLSTSWGSGPNQGTVPVCGMQKTFFDDSDSMVFPWQYHAPDNLMKSIELPANSNSRTVWSMRSMSETETCSINRNPADFSMPEAGNAYMIGGEDLKFGKKTPGDSSGFVNLDGLKRQKTRKLTGIKEHARHQTS